MRHSPWEACGFSCSTCSPQPLRVLWNAQGPLPCSQRQLFVPVLSQMNPVHAIPSCIMLLMIYSSHAVPPVSCYLVLPSPNTLLSTPSMNTLCTCSSRERPSFKLTYNSNCYNITINFRLQTVNPFNFRSLKQHSPLHHHRS